MSSARHEHDVGQLRPAVAPDGGQHPLTAGPDEVECVGQFHGPDRTGRAYAATGSGCTASAGSSLERTVSTRWMMAARIAPTSGATMKSQTWLERRAPDDQRRAQGPGRVHRGPGERDADEVHHHQPEADGDARRPLNRGLVRGEEHDQDEHRREHDLDQEGAALADQQVRLLAVPVGPQAHDGLGVQRRRREHPVQEVGAGDAAGELGDPVGRRLGELHAARAEEAERDRGVDVAARDGPDGVDEGDQHQPEGEGGGDDAGGVAQPEEPEPERLGRHPDGDDDQHDGARNSATSFFQSGMC